MSRTLRINPFDDYKKTGRDNKSNRASTWGKNGYNGNNWKIKYGVDPGRGCGVSKTGKLIAINANRSLKKSMRQKLNKECTVDTNSQNS